MDRQDLFEHQVANLDIPGTYFLIESRLQPLLIEFPVAQGCHVFLFDEVQLIESGLNLFCFVQFDVF